MKKILMATGLVFLTQLVIAQNVGIGTSTPQTNLHVYSTGSTIIRNECTAGSEASLELKTSGALFDFLEMRKWKTGAAGSVASIPLDGLSQISTGSLTTGGLLIGTKPAQPVYFTSSNIERMRIDANGNVGINNTSPGYALQVNANNKYGIYTTASINGEDTIAGIYGLAQSPTPVPYSAGVRGESNSTNYNGIGVLGIQRGSGWGVAGFIKEEGAGGLGYAAGVFGAAGYSLTGGGTGGFGIYGVNNNAGGTAGFFQDISFSGTSLALRTSGKLRLSGIGEATGKVLTSDASGNASWVTLPGGASVWAVSGNNIYNSNTGFVGIGHNNPQYALDVRNNVKGSLFMEYPLVGANATVRILRGVPESSSYLTTALYVEASGDRAARFVGDLGGIVSTSTSATGPGAFLDGNNGSGIAVEIYGAIKVSAGANKPIFTHITAAANIISNYSLITYPGAASNDFVMVIPNYTAGPVYNNHPIGVFFTAGKWAIFNQDLAAMPVGVAFNVLVIRQ